jgi:hypothetical protein
VERELRRHDLLGIATLDGRREALIEPFQLIDLRIRDPFGRRRGELFGDRRL